ncbi:MAG TPA: flagellar motor switch protein FliG, partial [Calditrichae bacterium]|nr:flagellar motor switch protein FliG [Calditrichia bacterium]
MASTAIAPDVSSMAQITDVNQLTGRQKAAILMVSLDVETAAEIFKNLNKNEIEKISLEIARLDVIRSSLIDSVIEEFYKLIQAQEYVASGGVDFAESVLEKAFGPSVAKELIEKIRNSMKISGFVTLQKADSNQLVNFLIKEHPQTIALILSYLTPEQTADVLAEFPEELRVDVAYRIATLGKVSPNLLKDIEEVVEQLAESVISEDMSKTGGASALA